jgi:hypothetical protein
MGTFKLRASAAGKLAPKPKTGNISETTKTYLKEWLTSQVFGVQKHIKNKYIEKGIQYEDEAIDFAIRILKLDFTIKNEKHFEDDYFTGTPDLITDEIVIDIKNSWDCFTFPLFEDEIPNSDYFYQLQVYMHLTGKRKALLVYVLLDTPATNYEAGIIYDVADELRIKTFAIDFDPAIIEMLKTKINYSREYLNTLTK